MNPDSPPEIFVLVRHFYGVASTAAIMMACIEDAAGASLGMDDVANTIKLAFVDDCLNSLDQAEDIEKLQLELAKFMSERGFPIKGFALSGSKPDESLSPEEHSLVGGWHWWPETENTRLKTPLI